MKDHRKIIDSPAAPLRRYIIEHGYGIISRVCDYGDKQFAQIDDLISPLPDYFGSGLVECGSDAHDQAVRRRRSFAMVKHAVVAVDAVMTEADYRAVESLAYWAVRQAADSTYRKFVAEERREVRAKIGRIRAARRERPLSGVIITPWTAVVAGAARHDAENGETSHTYLFDTMTGRRRPTVALAMAHHTHANGGDPDVIAVEEGSGPGLPPRGQEATDLRISPKP